MLKAIIAIIGMLIAGFIVWRLLQWQGDATDAKGNIIDPKHGRPRPSEAGHRDSERQIDASDT